MTNEEHIEHWIASADNDLSCAESNFETKHYDGCLFIGHLVMEKALKALFVFNSKNSNPPKIHNLLRLAELSKIDLSEEQSKFFSLVNKFQIEARYPEYKAEMFRIATQDFTKENFFQIKEYYLWLKSLIKLEK
ncbi:MAG: HEPN domain-containing protein [Candidatus Kapabacteria bacterium]|nr:HEPN domain-containing protein [Candidatus Kapabacteria bacterium]